MKVKLWGTRGSIASPGPETLRYGGNTSCVEVEGSDGGMLILDAGTGLRRLGMSMSPTLHRIDILLTHLHMDHIQGLAFFAPLRNPEVELHIWGPASTTHNLHARLTRYLSPPLFPVFLREMDSKFFLHEVPHGDFDIGEFQVQCDLICHPDPTVGYRISDHTATMTYLPDHEPALGVRSFPATKDWTSGYLLAKDVDLLIHDAQYTSAEYVDRVGFGHSAVAHTIEFARLVEARHLVPFHHDPAHDDKQLDKLFGESIQLSQPSFDVTPGMEGSVFGLGN